MDAYEAKKQELVAENSDLRALLRSMQVLHYLVWLSFSALEIVVCFMIDLKRTMYHFGTFHTRHVTLVSELSRVFFMQGDMRDFLNTPSGLMRPGTGASSHELEPPPTPLGGRTVITIDPWLRTRLLCILTSIW